MKIRTIAAAISIAAFLIAAAALTALISTTVTMDRALKRSTVASQLAQVGFLKILTRSDYLLHHEPRAAEQWRELDSRTISLLSRALELYQDPQISAKLKDISDDKGEAGELFTRMEANWDLFDRGDIDEAAFRATEDRIVAQLTFNAQDLVNTAIRMSRTSEREVDASHQAQTVSLGVLIGLLALFVLASTIITDRWIIRQLNGLRNDVSIFSTGDLDHRVAVHGGNEIVELAGEFNSMAARLQESYNSLESEIAERRRTEEEVVRLNEDLENRAVELEAYNEELQSFAYSVAHDLRSPLRGIDGFSRILQDEYEESLDVQGLAYLDRIRQAAGKMSMLIDGILELSRISRSDLWEETVNLSGMVQEVAERLKIEQPGRPVDFRIAPDVLATGDPALLLVLVENLLGNAWKFTSRGADALIEFGMRDVEGERTYFVKDNGVGFDMAYADKLFNPFQRLHSESQFKGTGIGLATVKRILRRHGGTIWAESRPGEGATFYFTL